MNYVEIKGGLGNQIFQYVFSKYLQEKTGRCSVLYTDFFYYMTDLPGVTSRKFDLDKFDTRYVSVSGGVRCNGIVREEDGDAEPVKTDGSYFYSGYWQDKKFFEAVKDRVLSELILKDEYINGDMKIQARKMRESESVSLHIRGTDYLKGQNREIFAEQTAEYYSGALDIIREKKGGNVRVFVFTDDVEHAEKILSDLGDLSYEIMPIAEPYQDLWLMAQAQNHIIANSSYSYWGARLGDDKGIVVAPRKWFLKMSDPDLYPDSWITL